MGAMKRRPRLKSDRATRELAAFWCAVLASDRSQNAWTIKLFNPACGPAAIRLAWKARLAALAENARQMMNWRPGVTRDAAAEAWARAEAMLQTGWRPA